MADDGHFGFMQINNKRNVFFGGSHSNIDNRLKKVAHAKFDACITNDYCHNNFVKQLD